MKTLAILCGLSLALLTAVRGQAVSPDQVSGLTTTASATASNTTAITANANALASKANIASPQFTGVVQIPKITGYGPPPSVTAGSGAGTGTGLSVTITGTDLAGYITLTTGATALSTATNATIATVTFGTPVSGAPNYVEIHPANATMASLYGPSAVFAPIPTSGTGFTISSNATALGTAVTYKFYYHVIW